MRHSKPNQAYSVKVLDSKFLDTIMPNADRIGLTSLPMPKPLEVEGRISRESVISGQLKYSERSVSETRKTMSEIISKEIAET